MTDKVLIIDFGSQYTQLIARRVRELGVYAEIEPYHNIQQLNNPSVKAIILSGGPASVYDKGSPDFDFNATQKPILGICYGAQLLTHRLGGQVKGVGTREYGRATLTIQYHDSRLLAGIKSGTSVWMSHGDSIITLPQNFIATAQTDDNPVAVIEYSEANRYGVQFHPEVVHTSCGTTLLKNFLYNIVGLSQSWTPGIFIEDTVNQLTQTLMGQKAICALSGGVDSTVAAVLVHKAIGDDLQCIFVDTGLLRKNEGRYVMEAYETLNLKVERIDASKLFFGALKGIKSPEEKRKIIGQKFIDVFEQSASKFQSGNYLVQGTIYPDVIESVPSHGAGMVIKSHHNVGGLPQKMKLKLVEPIRTLFKDEVRQVGEALGIPSNFLSRHPFPGPGLAIRIPGAITRSKVKLLQEADAIFIQALRDFGLYDSVWQAFAVLLPVQSVGIMGDKRTYEFVIALRAVTSSDGMTADFAALPHEFLSHVSNSIINNIRGINRVVYDISSKPPATIEWE